MPATMNVSSKKPGSSPSSSKCFLVRRGRRCRPAAQSGVRVRESFGLAKPGSTLDPESFAGMQGGQAGRVNFKMAGCRLGRDGGRINLLGSSALAPVALTCEASGPYSKTKDISVPVPAATLAGPDCPAILRASGSRTPT